MKGRFFPFFGLAVLLTACAGAFDREAPSSPPERLPTGEEVSSEKVENREVPKETDSVPVKKELTVDSSVFQVPSPAEDSLVAVERPDSAVAVQREDSPALRLPDSLGSVAKDTLADLKPPSAGRPDIYVEIPKLARRALALADSFFVAGKPDSAAAIVERFFVLKPLWEDWMEWAKTLNEKIRNGNAQKKAELKRRIVDIQNANSRRADFAEVRALADSIVFASPGDSLKAFADSLAELSRLRTCEKVKTVRDSALKLAREQAKFDEAERLVSNLLLHYPEFSDSLGLPNVLSKVSSMRAEESSASAAYWKAHSPQEALEKARGLQNRKQWPEAKAAYQKLKSSGLRGEALRGLDSLYSDYCTEKRERAATLFAESKRKPAVKVEKLKQAIESLDACLEFAPDFKNRETVLSNKEFLQLELGK